MWKKFDLQPRYFRVYVKKEECRLRNVAFPDATTFCMSKVTMSLTVDSGSQVRVTCTQTAECVLRAHEQWRHRGHVIYWGMRAHTLQTLGGRRLCAADGRFLSFLSVLGSYLYRKKAVYTVQNAFHNSYKGRLSESTATAWEAIGNRTTTCRTYAELHTESIQKKWKVNKHVTAVLWKDSWQFINEYPVRRGFSILTCVVLTLNPKK